MDGSHERLARLCLSQGAYNRGEKFSGTQKAKQQSVRVISTQLIKEGVMKRRRTLAVSVGMLVLGGLLLASGGPGVTPLGRRIQLRCSNSFGRFWTSSIRFWRPLRAAAGVERSLRAVARVPKTITRCGGTRRCRCRSGSSSCRPSTATRYWIRKPAWSGKSPRRRLRYPRQTSA